MGRHWLALLGGLLALLSGAAARADQLPSEPMLRINAGGHIAPIRAIATDAKEQFAVTASDDKTVRVWSLPDGKLRRTIWLPAGDGNLGKAYAVALSPDGGTIAAGGWTGQSGAEKNIYLFDRASGALSRRLSGLPNLINHLAYSPDGKRLAAAIGGTNGIRVFDPGDGYRPLPSDADYANASRSVDFDGSGRLVSVSYDGYVRLYAPDHYDKPAVPKTKVTGIVRPHSVAFSPDGRHIAVGDYDSPTVAILRDRDLASETFPTIAGFDDTGLTVAWSQDGARLFAGGYNSSSANGLDRRLARRWDETGSGAAVDITGARDLAAAFVPLRGQQMLFADARGFGIIDNAGKPARLSDQGNIDVRRSNATDAILISPDARTVLIGEYGTRRTYHFDFARRAVTVDLAPGAALSKPTIESTSIKLTDWRNSAQPKVNGVKLELENSELSRSVALVPGTDRFALGASWSLRLFDSKAKQIWSVAAPGAVWGVNVSADGKLIVAAYDDGAIRWHRVSDGKELLALFMHPDGRRWVAWTPQGYYDASAGADDLIGWQVNHGYDQAPDYFPVARFRDQFNRPDIVASVLDTLNVDEAVSRAANVSGRKAAAPVGGSLPPVVKIISPADLSSVQSSPITITYFVSSPTPVTGMTVQVDGRPVSATPPTKMTSGPEGAVESLTIDMPPHSAAISLVARNETESSEPAIVHIGWQGAKDWYKPDLYVLAIGVSKYKDSSLNLVYPDKDATDFLKVMRAQQGGLYKEVHVYPQDLVDDHATRDEIRKGLNWLRKSTTSRDIAVLFLSGHGQNDAGGHYHYLPYDADESDLDFTTIQDFEIADFLSKVPGKVVAFLDTCFSGALHARGPVQPDVDKLANELASAENGIIVFTSSTGRQFSLEKPEWQNGAFTKALVEAVKGGADFEHEQTISIAELEVYLAHRVRELTGGEQSPMSTKPKTITDLVIATVVP
jgi:WD40 repeat protein